MATRHTKAIISAVLALAATLSGCAHNSYRNDSGNGLSGDAVRATLAAQVINPAAALNPNPAAGVDGNTARAAIERYEAPPETNNGAVSTIHLMTK
jgi:type IV pilus biogenesis protein CpaD/CtpE